MSIDGQQVQATEIVYQSDTAAACTLTYNLTLPIRAYNGLLGYYATATGTLAVSSGCTRNIQLYTYLYKWTVQPGGTGSWQYVAGDQVSVAPGKTLGASPFKVCNTLGSGSWMSEIPGVKQQFATLGCVV